MSNVFSPEHYTEMSIEPIDVIEACKLDYHSASALAYIMRAGRKGSVEDDLKKALNFLHRRVYGTWFTGPRNDATCDHLTWCGMEYRDESVPSEVDYYEDTGRDMEYEGGKRPWDDGDWENSTVRAFCSEVCRERSGK
jgi:hypothetical protein